MDNIEFIDGLIRSVRNPSISGTVDTLSSPSGRKGRLLLKDISSWYKSLNDHERDSIRKIVEISVDSAIFVFLCVFDGVRVILDSKDKDGVEFNISGNNDDFLHEIYNSKKHELQKEFILNGCSEAGG